MVDELDAIDGLRLALFEELEGFCGQPGDGLPVLRGVRVDGDVMRSGAERWRPLRIGFLVLSVEEQTSDSQGQTQNGRDAAHRLSGRRWQSRL
jgi:hypothetical protein